MQNSLNLKFWQSQCAKSIYEFLYNAQRPTIITVDRILLLDCTSNFQLSF